MAYAARDTYALELRGLGVVWTTGTITLPGITPAPDYRPGLLDVGGTLRASIGVLDTVAKTSGVTFQIAGDSALDLMRAGGDPVRDSGATVARVAPMQEQQTAATTSLSFTGPLTPGDRYLVGAECIEIVAETEVTGGIYRYTVVRGVRGSLAEEALVYWPPGADLETAPFPAGGNGYSSRCHVLDLVYPDLDPPTLTGWPVRLWRQTGAGTPVVVYEGAVGRIRSSGAVITVETQSTLLGDLSRAYRVPMGGLVGSVGSGDIGGTRVGGVALALQIRVQGDALRSPRYILGIGAAGRLRDAQGRPIVAIPRSSVETPDLDRWRAVQICIGEWWLVVPISEWLTPPFVVDTDRVGEITLTSSRYWYAALAAQPGTGAAPVVAYGRADRAERVYTVAQTLYGTEPVEQREGYEWLECMGLEFRDPREARIRQNGYDDFEIEDREGEVRSVGSAAQVQGVYLLPSPRPGAFFRGDLRNRVSPSMGAERLEVDWRAPQIGGGTYLLRPPYLGRTQGEVIALHFGALARGLSVSPLGVTRVIDWSLPGLGAETAVTQDELMDTITLELGETGRVSSASLIFAGSAYTIQVVGGSLSPRGMQIRRDVSAAIGIQSRGQDDAPIVALAAQWAGILSRYRGTMPVATLQLRDDGSGALQAITPGARIRVTDPASPSAAGTRGLTDAIGIVLEVALGTMARTATVTALLIDYGTPVPPVWAPAVRINDPGGAGTDVTLSVVSMGNGRSLARLQEIGTVGAILYTNGGETVVSGLSIQDADPVEGTVRVTAAASVTYPAGGVLTVADFPPAAGVAGAFGFYGRSRWI